MLKKYARPISAVLGLSFFAGIGSLLIIAHDINETTRKQFHDAVAAADIGKPARR